MTLYGATARVRVRGAVGAFYVREFLFPADAGESVADAWLRSFGSEWELECIVGAEVVAEYLAGGAL